MLQALPRPAVPDPRLSALADIAKSANVPIVALAHNSGKYWRNKKYSKRPGTIKLVISEPIIVGDQNTKEVMARIQDWTQKQLDNMA